MIVAIDFLLSAVENGLGQDSTMFSLTVITFAALESVVGLSFLLFYSRTGVLTQLSRLSH